MTKKNAISSAAQKGDHVATLQALRDRLAVAIDDEDTPPRDLAALSRQLTQVMRELEGLKNPDEDTPLAELFKQFESEFS